MFKDKRREPTEPQDVQVPDACQSRIGPHLVMDGRLKGREDLTIEGRYKGRIELSNGSLFIAQGARVQADVRVKSLTLQGELKGNIDADERVLVAETASLTGDITASRVSIMNGARFKGAIKMKANAST